MLAEVVHSVSDFPNQSPENIHHAALVIGGSFFIEGASLLIAINAVKKGAAAEGMTKWDYVWRGHDPTSVAVMTEDGAVVTGLAIAAASLVAVHTTGNAICDPIGSIIVDFKGLEVVQNYLERTGREEWAKQFGEAAKCEDDFALLKLRKLLKPWEVRLISLKQTSDELFLEIGMLI